jgi:hypothetical protein
LKENLLWVRTFDTIEELRAALVEFATRYNETWLVARDETLIPGVWPPSHFKSLAEGRLGKHQARFR